ncbi:MAG: chorismate mutase [Prosthecobacter sp.]|nr:chorismate mutase [Prosthecobacter sp.]
MSFRTLTASLLLLLLTSCATQPNTAATLGNLMVQRLSWMDEVAQIKQARSLPITDPVREAALLQSMEKLGAESALPPRATRQFFSGQMTAARQLQSEWLNQHPAHAARPQAAPLPDLNFTIRPALDQIGRQMISALADARQSPAAAAEIIAKARQRLDQAGYSAAVITPAIHGLEAALK